MEEVDSHCANANYGLHESYFGICRQRSQLLQHNRRSARLQVGMRIEPSEVRLHDRKLLFRHGHQH
jgi:hypothetical protein